MSRVGSARERVCSTFLLTPTRGRKLCRVTPLLIKRESAECVCQTVVPVDQAISLLEGGAELCLQTQAGTSPCSPGETAALIKMIHLLKSANGRTVKGVLRSRGVPRRNLDKTPTTWVEARAHLVDWVRDHPPRRR